MNAILSIKPHYSADILCGIKRVEFRKQPFKRNVDKFYIYSTSPEKKIIGYFTTENIVKGKTEDIWNTYGKMANLSKADYMKYFEGKDNAVAIVIKKVILIEPAIDPYSKIPSFTAPQSYRYYDFDIESL
nr:ASCH domain-containing protein [Parabacteroides goldsteinii]